MKNSFKRILIAADLSQMDDKLLSIVSQFTSRSKPDKIYLTHIIPNMLVPANAELEFHKMFTSGYPVDEKVKDILTGKSEAFFEANDFPIEVEVIEGKPYRKLLEMIELKEIDLLVVGHKEHSEGSGITAKRIARKAACHILFVPENAKNSFSKILVPTDFSENAANAMKAALSLCDDAKQVTALHVVKMLQSDYYYGMALNQKFRDSLIETAWDTFYDFKSRFDLSEVEFEKEVVINDHNNIASQIKTFVNKKDFDMVVMGAQGHSAFENFLFGSVTETFVNFNTKVPVLIIR